MDYILLYEFVKILSAQIECQILFNITHVSFKDFMDKIMHKINM